MNDTWFVLAELALAEFSFSRYSCLYIVLMDFVLVHSICAFKGCGRSVTSNFSCKLQPWHSHFVSDAYESGEVPGVQ